MATLARDPLFTRRPLAAVPQQQPPAYVNLLTSTLAAAAAQTPFKPTHWSRPFRLSVRLICEPEPDQNRLPLTTAAAQAPFKPIALAGPKRLNFSPQLLAPQNRLTLITQASQSPIIPPIWSMPVHIARAVIDTNQSGIFVDIVPMLRQNDWPGPVPRKFVPQVIVPQNILTTTIAPPLPPAPFKPMSNAVPVRIVRASPLFEMQDLTALLSPDVTPPVPPSPVPPGPAGRKQRRHFYVEIDGDRFPVEDAEHAKAVLDRAKELAVQAAERQARALLAKRPVESNENLEPLKLKLPRLRTNTSVAVAPIARDINRIYREVARTMELQWLLQHKLADEDDEESLLLL